MRMREVLVALIDEAKINHWDDINAVWRHPWTGDDPVDACGTCEAARAAQTVLSINFVDVVPGDQVRIGDSPFPLHFGVVEHVGMVVDVRMGYASAHGIITPADAPVGRFNGASLIRITRGG